MYGLVIGMRGSDQKSLVEIKFALKKYNSNNIDSYCEEIYKINCRINTTYMVELLTIYLTVFLIYNMQVHGYKWVIMNGG